MSKARPTFEETLHDWQADPSNWRAGALFQPKGLGASLVQRRRRARLATASMIVLSLVVAAMALSTIARALHLP